MDDEWLIIHTPTGPRCWPLGAPTNEERDHLVNAARVACGLPAEATGVPDSEDGHVVMLTVGEPHPTLLAEAAVGTVGELRSVAPQAVADHMAARRRIARRLQVDAALAAMATLDPAERAEVVAAVSATPTVAR